MTDILRQLSTGVVAAVAAAASVDFARLRQFRTWILQLLLPFSLAGRQRPSQLWRDLVPINGPIPLTTKRRNIALI
jgi:hypothetical protein